jgi:phosphoenolpyruvate carboxylase|tara:strand:- start:661 stop:849 length:189 start_codon:yes stop_codon:yes gene_type:complete
MEKQTTRQSVAEWYTTQIFETSSTPISEVEWLIENLKESAFEEIEDFYDEQMNNLEAEGFFK